MRLRFILFAMLSLPAAAWADVYVRDDIIKDPTPERFSVCHGTTCAMLSETRLSKSEWAEIVSSFQPPAATAAIEREQVRAAIALMERFVGAAVGTWADRGRNENNDVSLNAMMDCIDESINTALYLTMFLRQGLLRHHEVRNNVTRGWFLMGWPHTTAVIRDRKDGSQWAVDSWFLDNGQPPFVVPLDQWRDRWEPDTPGKSP